VSIAEDLLNPINPESPAGQNLRYDSVYDQIAEARLEDDATLPVGQWARQTKRADHQLVLSLSQDALLKRSKDLWLAAWWGEAHIQLNGLSALFEVVDLLLGLQERFWDSLYPEIEESDLGMRAAPLQWAMDRFTNLVYELPVVSEAIGYRDYKAARTPAPDNSSNGLTVDALEAALKETSKAYYLAVEKQLIETRKSLEKLYLFCDEKYRDDGPSFVKLRTALDEVYNLVASLLRVKRELDPDPIEPAPALEPIAVIVPEPVIEPQGVHAESAESTSLPEAEIAREISAPVAVQQAETQHLQLQSSAEPQSWEQALEGIQKCAIYLAKERPYSATSYMLLTAMHCGEMRDSGFAQLQQPPSTDLRMALRKASREAGGQLLLEESLRAVALPGSGAWLDLHHYIWLASREIGYQAIAESVVDVVRALLRQDSSLPNTAFDDGTPTAAPETKSWIEAEILVPHITVAPIEAPPVSAVPVEPAQTEPTVKQAPDITEEAEALAESGNLLASVQLLMNNAVSSPDRRTSFYRRLHVARLCLAAGQRSIAGRLLEQLLHEVDEYRLETWEGGALVGEIIALLLKSLSETGEFEAERRTLQARLCQIDPVQALTLEGVA